MKVTKYYGYTPYLYDLLALHLINLNHEVWPLKPQTEVQQDSDAMFACVWYTVMIYSTDEISLLSTHSAGSL